MLGRVRSDADAIAAYQRVRALAGDGFEDALGLAASSLGQEARIHLERGDTASAIALYAEQAALGHPDGAVSLLQVTRDLVHRGDERRLLAGPLGQRLLAIYLHARAYELTDAESDRVWGELAATDGVAGAGFLAAAAYRSARWELAARFAATEPDAVESLWVRAKLSLRDGDRAAADRFLASAAGRCSAPRDDESDTTAARDRIDGERAILALSGDRPVDALVAMWPARHRYPTDVAHIAERVLTIDELRTFVDGLPVLPRWNEPVPIRDVLARRLMRDGRYLEALPYTDAEPRTDAALFASAMSRTRTGDDFARAHALYEASRIARRHGMEILGTEHAPDWGTVDGAFDLGEYAQGGGWPSDEPSPWVSGGERTRIARHAPAIDRRYHYRYVASQLAEQAADHLPPRSQAFAAVLCHATRYVFDIDADRRDQLYGRYVSQGATVDFASTFGQECPEPEFERARSMFPPTKPRRHWIAFATPGGLGLLMLLGKLVFAWRRRSGLARPAPEASWRRRR
jgi:hypothetical protein